MFGVAVSDEGGASCEASVVFRAAYDFYGGSHRVCSRGLLKPAVWWLVGALAFDLRLSTSGGVFSGESGCFAKSGGGDVAGGNLFPRMATKGRSFLRFEMPEAFPHYTYGRGKAEMRWQRWARSCFWSLLEAYSYTRSSGRVLGGRIWSM